MPKRVLIAVALLTVLPAIGPAPRAADAPIRLLTFNLLHGGLGSGVWGDGQRLEERLGYALDEIRRLDPDVIGLQEASVGRGRGDVAARVAEALGYHHVWAGATSRFFRWRWLAALMRTVMNFDEGPAIVSRYPIASSRTELLARCDEPYRRVLLCARIDMPGGPLEACSTHPTGSRCHAESIAALLAGRDRSVPLVLMGDLNGGENAAATLLLERLGLVDTFRAAQPSAPGLTVWQDVTRPDPTVRRRVDYVLAGPAGGGAVRVLGSRVILDRPRRAADGTPLWASDHYGVVSDVTFGR